MSYAGLKITTAAAIYPVTVDEVKANLRLDGTDQDTLLTSYIAAATDAVERASWVSLINRSITITYDYCFPGTIELPAPPLSSVTSINYIDVDGDTQTVDTEIYAIDNVSTLARVYPALNQIWPTTADVKNAVTLIYVAGYGATAATVPAVSKQLIIQLASDYYEHAEAGSEISLKENPQYRFMLEALSKRYSF